VCVLFAGAVERRLSVEFVGLQARRGVRNNGILCLRYSMLLLTLSFLPPMEPIQTIWAIEKYFNSIRNSGHPANCSENLSSSFTALYAIPLLARLRLHSHSLLVLPYHGLC
jgi:hypothetical protein